MQTIEGTEIYNGEDGDNDLSEFQDETIKTHLKRLIQTSSITVVLVSKGMKDPLKAERDQWIPWELQYSLTRTAYGKVRSNRNGILAVILPDKNGTYDHYYQRSNCQHCNVITHKTGDLFAMIGKNMFNLKNPAKDSCPSPLHGTTYHVGNDYSYIHPVKWEDFIKDPSGHIDIVEERKERTDNYNLKVRLSD